MRLNTNNLDLIASVHLRVLDSMTLPMNWWMMHKVRPAFHRWPQLDVRPLGTRLRRAPL